MIFFAFRIVGGHHLAIKLPSNVQATHVTAGNQYRLLGVYGFIFVLFKQQGLHLPTCAHAAP
jgi:hypothetical protein